MANASRYGSRLAFKLFGKRTCKPNSVVCGHSSRRRVAADVHQRPTRRFRQLLEPPGRIGPMRNDPLALEDRFPPYLVLLRVGFTLTPGFTAGAVRSYRTISPLPRRQNSMLLRGRPLPKSRGVAGAVYFLWHWPSMRLEAHVPDVIRHTALRSSDFPPPADIDCSKPPAATARSSCQL